MEPRLTSTERRIRRLNRRARSADPKPSRRGRLVPSTAKGRIGGGVAFVFVVLSLWTAWDLRAARSELLGARRELSAAAGNLSNAADADATTTLRRATRKALARTESANRRVNRSPVLRLAAVVPGVSTQRRGIVTAVRTARDAARVGDALAAAAETERAGLTVANGSIDAVAARRLAASVEKAGKDLAALPRSHRGGQWSPVANATRDLDTLLTSTAERLVNGGGVMRVAADLLGAQGPQRVFIALLNNAEMRDQGMVLSYALAETADGGFRIAQSGSVEDIIVPRAVSDPPLPAGTQRIFGALAPAQYWQGVNATADKTLSGALMRSMYRSATGTEVHGVVALDVPALSKLLAVTGPVTVAGIAEPITAENATRILLNDLYAVAPGESYSTARTERLAKLAQTTTAVIEKVRTSSVSGAAVVHALGDAALGGHAWVSSALPEDQAALERAGLSGSPGSVNPERTIHLAVQNGTANKLDYFVKPKVDVDVSIADDGSALVNMTVDIPNEAPVPTPSTEQYGPDNRVTNVAGLYRARVYFWGPKGSDQVDATEESGLNLSFKVADVRAGTTERLTFTTVIPNAVQDGALRLRFVPQARVEAMQLNVRVNGVGWRVENASQALIWDRTHDLTWKLSRR